MPSLRTSRWYPLTLGLVGVILLAGLGIFAVGFFSGTGPKTTTTGTSTLGTSGGGSVAPTPGRDIGAPEAVSGGGKTSTTDRSIIESGVFTVTVNDVEKTVDQVRAVAKDLGGSVTSLDITRDGSVFCPIPLTEVQKGIPVSDMMPQFAPDGMTPCPNTGGFSATIAIRVPSDKFSTARDRVRAFSKTQKFDTESSNAFDVTDQIQDTKLRLTNKQAEAKSLRQLLGQATKISDILAIRQQLSQVELEIESLQQQLRDLGRQTTFATLTVTIRPAVQPGATISQSIGDRFRQAWTSFVGNINGILTGLIYFAVYLLLILPLAALAALAVWLITRAIQRRNQSGRQ